MRAIWAFSLTIAVAATALPAEACRMYRPLDPAYVEQADVVLVGRVSHYEIVRDPAARERRRRQLADPGLPPTLRALLENQNGFISDYARFRVTVDQMLKGPPAGTLTVIWDNSTFGEPETLTPGPYLIALRRPDPRGPYPEAWTALQAICSSPFILAADGAEAAAVRRLVR